MPRTVQGEGTSPVASVFVKTLQGTGTSSPLRRFESGVTGAWWRLCGVLLLLSGSFLFAEVPNWPDYRLGQRVQAPVYSPLRFEVMNPEATALRKARAARRVPLFFRRELDADLQVEGRLRALLREKRLAFGRLLEAAFQERVLKPEQIQSGQFREVLARYRQAHRGFPLSRALAVVWAGDEPDDAWLESWTQRLREAMATPIGPTRLPKGWRWTARILLFPRSHGQPDPPLARARELAEPMARTNLVQLAKARQRFRQSFPDNQRGLGRFLSGFLTNNCHLSRRLTREARAERRAEVWVTDRYRLGQPVVREGQVLDEQALRTLRELKLRLGRAGWSGPPDPLLGPPVEAFNLQAGESSTGPGWTRWGGLVLSGLGAWALWVGWRRRAVRTLPALPAPPPLPGMSTHRLDCPACHSPLLVQEDGTVRPARSAESGAHRLDPVRFMVAFQLSAWLKRRFIRVLLGQREDSRRREEQAEREINSLAERLEKARAPLQERLRIYEARISELERELSRKGEINQELIQAQIEAARQKLKREQEGGGHCWN